jgi:hypothetical protein
MTEHGHRAAQCVRVRQLLDAVLELLVPPRPRRADVLEAQVGPGSQSERRGLEKDVCSLRPTDMAHRADHERVIRPPSGLHDRHAVGHPEDWSAASTGAQHLRDGPRHPDQHVRYGPRPKDGELALAAGGRHLMDMYDDR